MMDALLGAGKGNAVVDRVAIPSLGQGEILVKNHAVALNPTDWKHRDFLTEPTEILGCDFAGTVSRVGPDVTHLQEGDRVAGFVHGGRYRDEGSFAEFVKAQASKVWKVPKNVSWEEAAASGGIAPLTAVQALFMRLKLNQPSSPTKDPVPVLVWGGTTSVGLYAVQLLRLSGYTVLATASEKNWPLLKSLGVTSTYDYSDSDVSTKIATDYPSLSLGFDCISEKGTTVQLAKSFKSGQGKIITLLPVDDEGLKAISGVEVEPTLVYTVLGRKFEMWKTWEVIPEDVTAIEAWLSGPMTDLMGSGALKSNPILSREGGLHKINEGLDYLKEGKNRAQKLTYRLV